MPRALFKTVLPRGGAVSVVVGGYVSVMNWERRLPEGVKYKGRNGDSLLSFGVTMPTDADGMLPVQCPAHEEHKFKVFVSSTDEGDAEVRNPMTCAYCGHRDDGWAFTPMQQERAREAMKAAAQQMMVVELSKAIRQGLAGSKYVTFKPGSPPPVGVLPTYDIDETRRAMLCAACSETTAVYGLAFYCPYCGVMAPARQFRDLIQVQRDRLAALDGVDRSTRQRLDEAGVYTVTHESTIKDGFGALETYLKHRFRAEAPGKQQPQSTTFQRLNDANALYKQHLNLDLEAAAGPEVWAGLLEAAAIRHVLTHNAGTVDEQFLKRMPDWPQGLGQRIQVTRKRVDDFLDVLASFAAAVL